RNAAVDSRVNDIFVVAIRRADLLIASIDGSCMELLGIPAGPMVGQAWRYLNELRLDRGPLSRDEAEAELRRWAKATPRGGRAPNSWIGQGRSTCGRWPRMAPVWCSASTEGADTRAESMARHDQTRDGGRPSDEVDPSKIVRPKDDDDGRHTDRGGSSEDDRDTRDDK
ncbi:MAG: hypothetical protein ACRDTJ_07130, partial [Pseudonocardiaceae bacterium]